VLTTISSKGKRRFFDCKEFTTGPVQMTKRAYPQCASAAVRFSIE
jgi:hypothetical protein